MVGRAVWPLLFAFLTTVSPAGAKQADVDSATAEEKQRAQDFYVKAMADFEAGRFEPALEKFRASYEAVRSPNSHFMVARTLARMGHNVEAYEVLSRVIAEAEAYGQRYSDTLTAARAKLADIRPRIGLLSLDASKLPKGSKLVLEDKDIALERTASPIAVLPGKVHVQAKLPDGRSVEGTTEVVTGGEGTLRLEPPADDPALADSDVPFVERVGGHRRYHLELEAHGFFTTVDPKGPASEGGGPGLRVSVPLARGVLGLNDALAVGAGFDWAATSTDAHFWIPIVAQYNLWIIPELSILLEPGLAIFAGAGEDVYPVFQAGVRYALVKDRLNVTARVGVPLISAGVSVLF